MIDLDQLREVDQDMPDHTRSFVSVGDFRAVCEELESLRAERNTLAVENVNLRAWLDGLDRKVAHGCTDAFCSECDGVGNG